MKKMLALLLAATLLLSGPVFTQALAAEQGDWPNEPAVDASASAYEEEVTAAAALFPDNNLPVKSAVLMEANGGRILYSLNEKEKLPPASITKIMSLLLIMEALEQGKIKLDDKVACSENAASFGGSQIWLKPGEEMTVDELLRAACIASANDATVCLAEHVAGSELGFVQMMNDKAKELGMTGTNFACAAGLDTPDHYTTAEDIAIMSRELLKHDLIKNYSTVWMDSLRGGATQLVNTNRLVRFYEGATGLKTGTTSKAGKCLSATAEREGLGLIAVVMGSPSSDERFAAARSLLDWGFANYTMAKLNPPDLAVPMKVNGGIESQVELYSDQPAGFVVEKSKSDTITQDVTLSDSVEAPVEKDQVVGSVIVCVDGERVMDYPIKTTVAVDKMTLFRALGILGRVLLSIG
ncbi:MAG: D-alanyl-D-alanine carboxypeptidase family protein [Angelakisella sp.]|nr:D-alanyl-D-alanine carboxypeptidase family protein [Angelakisella sp.]